MGCVSSVESGTIVALTKQLRESKPKSATFYAEMALFPANPPTFWRKADNGKQAAMRHGQGLAANALAAQHRNGVISAAAVYSLVRL
jgi:hypothetical protein